MSRGIVRKNLVKEVIVAMFAEVEYVNRNPTDGNMQGIKVEENKMGEAVGKLREARGEGIVLIERYSLTRLNSQRIYRLERDEEVMFLVGVKPGNVFSEGWVGSVEMRQTDEHRGAVAAGAHIHQTGGGAFPVAKAVPYVYHVRILSGSVRHFCRVFSFEEVLGGGGRFEILCLIVRVAPFRVVSQRLLAEIVPIALQAHVIDRVRVLERQWPAKNARDRRS